MLLSDERAVIHAIGVDGTIRFQVIIINFYAIHLNYHVDRSKTDADNVDRHANRVEFGVISTNFHEINVNQHSDNSKRIAYHSKHNAIAVFIGCVK